MHQEHCIYLRGHVPIKISSLEGNISFNQNIGWRLIPFLRFLIDYSGAEENPVRMATGRMGEVYKESGNEINSLKSFSDRVQEELNVFFNKVRSP